jgi:hypothetical protein
MKRRTLLAAASMVLIGVSGLAPAQAQTTLNLGFIGAAQAPEAIAMR